MSLLAGGYVDAAKVDAVILGSDLMLNLDKHEIRAQCVELLSACGLEHAYVFPLFLGECGNFSAALDLAAGLINGGRYARVLVLVSESRGETRQARVGPFLMSDSATAVLVECDVGVGLRIDTVLLANDTDSMLSRANHGLGREANAATAMLRSLRFTRRVAEAWRDELKPIITAGASILFPNVFDTMNQSFCRELGVPFAMDNAMQSKTEIAHASAADIVFNLSKALDAGRLKPGCRVVALNSGVHVWNAFVGSLGDMQHFRADAPASVVTMAS